MENTGTQGTGYENFMKLIVSSYLSFCLLTPVRVLTCLHVSLICLAFCNGFVHLCLLGHVCLSLMCLSVYRFLSGRVSLSCHSLVCLLVCMCLSLVCLCVCLYCVCVMSASCLQVCLPTCVSDFLCLSLVYLSYPGYLFVHICLFSPVCLCLLSGPAVLLFV